MSAVTVPVLSRKCQTCIFRPGNLMHLNEGHQEQMVRDSLAQGGSITCHSTLPYGGHADIEKAMCRGFFDVHKHDSLGITLAEAMGAVVFVDPPSKQPSHG